VEILATVRIITIGAVDRSVAEAVRITISRIWDRLSEVVDPAIPLVVEVDTMVVNQITDQGTGQRLRVPTIPVRKTRIGAL
jgi:metal-sulfur cluster biosynthetic enzyme